MDKSKLAEIKADAIVTAIKVFVFPAAFNRINNYYTIDWHQSQKKYDYNMSYLERCIGITLVNVLLTFEGIVELVLARANLEISTKALIEPTLESAGLDSKVSGKLLELYMHQKGKYVSPTDLLLNSKGAWAAKTFGVMESITDSISPEDVKRHYDFFRAGVTLMDLCVEDLSDIWILMYSDAGLTYDESNTICVEDWMAAANLIVSEHFGA